MKTIVFPSSVAAFGGAIRVDYDRANAFVVVPFVGAEGHQATIHLARRNLKPVDKWEAFYLADKATEEIDRIGFPLVAKHWRIDCSKPGEFKVLVRYNHKGRFTQQGTSFAERLQAVRFIQDCIREEKRCEHHLEMALHPDLLQYASRTNIEHKLRHYGFTVEYDMPGEGFILCDLDGEPVDATTIGEGQAMNLIRQLEEMTT